MGRWPSLVGVLAAGVLLSAGTAFGLSRVTGTPAALRLATAVLRASNGAPSATLVERGDLYDCPWKPGLPMVLAAGRRPKPACRRAVLVNRANLVGGRQSTSYVTVSAPGYPTRLTLTTASGEWSKTSRTRCWRSDGRAHHLALFTYGSERLTILRRTSRVIVLHGAMPSLTETDVIDARTLRIRSILTIGATPWGASHQTTTLSYLSRLQSLPVPTPRCS